MKISTMQKVVPLTPKVPTRRMTTKEVAEYLGYSIPSITRFKQRDYDPLPCEAMGPRAKAQFDFEKVKAWKERNMQKNYEEA